MHDVAVLPQMCLAPQWTGKQSLLKLPHSALHSFTGMHS